MPAPLISRDEVVRRLFGVFRTYGFEGATLARLSEATGLGRASLYHYFPDGKEGMVREVIAMLVSWLHTNVKAPLEHAGTPASRIKTVMRNLATGYDNGLASCLVNLFGVGDAHAIAIEDLRELAQAYVSPFEAFLRTLGMTQNRAREIALDTVTQIEGALVMARALDDQRVFTKRLEQIEKQYLAHIRAA
jgi:AcrR family transcriptional regulator